VEGRTITVVDKSGSTKRGRQRDITTYNALSAKDSEIGQSVLTYDRKYAPSNRMTWCQRSERQKKRMVGKREGGEFGRQQVRAQ